jgi:hypothetical protein
MAIFGSEPDIAVECVRDNSGALVCRYKYNEGVALAKLLPTEGGKFLVGAVSKSGKAGDADRAEDLLKKYLRKTYAINEL